MHAWSGQGGRFLPVEAITRRPFEGELLEVRTRLGRRVRCTRDHPFVTREGLKLASELTVDDWLPLAVGEVVGPSPRPSPRSAGRGGLETARRVLNDRVTFVERPYDALAGADALFVVTELNEFRHPDFERMKALMKAPVVFDGRNIYSPSKMRELGFTCFSIGRK